MGSRIVTFAIPSAAALAQGTSEIGLLSMWYENVLVCFSFQEKKGRV